jgi:hypothetical protein
MRERKSEKHTLPAPWHVPVALEDIAETGQHFDLVADKDVRAAVARIAGLRDLPRLEANFDVTRHGASALRVAGRVSATVGQNCVVTLEPLVNGVEEEVDLMFAPPQPAKPKTGEAEASEQTAAKVWSDKAWFDKAWSDTARGEPEPLIGGVVDLGALATEFVILGLDPYPRKSGAVFEPPQDVRPDGGPFAALARLTKGRDGS